MKSHRRMCANSCDKAESRSSSLNSLVKKLSGSKSTDVQSLSWREPARRPNTIWARHEEQKLADNGLRPRQAVPGLRVHKRAGGWNECGRASTRSARPCTAKALRKPPAEPGKVLEGPKLNGSRHE